MDWCIVMDGFVIRPKPPYMISLHLKLFSLPGRPTPCLYVDGCCRRIFDGDVFEVCIDGEPFEPVLLVRVYRGDLGRVRRVVEHIYNVRLDYNAFMKCVNDYPVLRDLASRYPGLRPALVPSLHEAVVKNIVNQQIPIRLALRIVSRLVEEYGGKTVVGGRVFYDFPKPEALASRSIEELRRLSLSRRKAEYIIGLSKLVAEGYDLESLREKAPAIAIEELTRIRGIGPWTAKLSLMASTGNLSMDLLEDKAVANGLRRLGLRDKLGEITSRCRNYIGLVMYLSALAWKNRSK